MESAKDHVRPGATTLFNFSLYSSHRYCSSFNLFSNSPFIEAAKSAADASLPVNLEFKQDGKWLELIAIEPAGNPEQPQEFTTDEIPF